MHRRQPRPFHFPALGIVVPWPRVRRSAIRCKPPRTASRRDERCHPTVLVGVRGALHRKLGHHRLPRIEPSKALRRTRGADGGRRRAESPAPPNGRGNLRRGRGRMGGAGRGVARGRAQRRRPGTSVPESGSIRPGARGSGSRSGPPTGPGARRSAGGRARAGTGLYAPGHPPGSPGRVRWHLDPRNHRTARHTRRTPRTLATRSGRRARGVVVAMAARWTAPRLDTTIGPT